MMEILKVSLRILIGIFGSYSIVVCFSIAFALYWPGSENDTLHLSMMMSFLLYPILLIYSFSSISLSLLSLQFIGITGLLSMTCWVFPWFNNG